MAYVESYILHCRGCGTHISSAQIAAAERLFQTNRLPPPDENSTATATLDIHFHVVYANETLDGGFVPYVDMPHASKASIY